ncbi:MAG: hypothetical protein H7289_12565, partial [Mucilaginibacter sp.]|nr:hypothetical protein [Mucilaginibacter sp.]
MLLILPLLGFGQTVPVAPNMLLDIGGSGGYASVTPTCLKFDAQGNMYVTGNSGGLNKVDFDPSAGVTYPVSDGSSLFLAKYSAAGALVWVKGLVAGLVLGAGEVNGLDVDRNGNITVIGQIHPKRQIDPSDYPNYFVDAFVLHLDNSGNVLWEKFVESGSKVIPKDPGRLIIYSDIQTGYKVASDAAGNLIAVFSFGGSPDVDGKVTAKANYDGLVVKYDPNGNVIWKFDLGATVGRDNSALAALVDKDNNIIIAGYGNGMVNYNPLGTPVIVNEEHSIFLAKYSPAGILQWIKSINGYEVDYYMTLALDGQDNIYVNGLFTAPINFDGMQTLSPNGQQDMFIAKYSSAGNLLYDKNMGGTGAAMLNRGMVAGPDNSLYLSGNFKGKPDLDPSSSVAEINSNGTLGMFLAKYDDNGNYQWAFGIPSFGNAGDRLDVNLSSGSAISNVGAKYVNVNSNNEILLIGQFQTTKNFDATGCGLSNMTAQGSGDIFIVRYAPTTEVPITNNT